MTAIFDRPKLDRQVRFDERSRNYGIRQLIGQDVPRKTTRWQIPNNFPLNQGREGACVGFAWAHQLGVGPIFNPSTQAAAFNLYREARLIDQMEGNDFAEGATLLAGAKAAKRSGKVTAYRWAFGLDDVIDALCSHGPVVLGINWYDGMYATEAQGRIRVNGPLVGGHAILATGYIHRHPKWSGNWIEVLNSWGRTYGNDGYGYFRDIDLGMLLDQDGEACIADEATPRPIVPPTWWHQFLGRWRNR